MLLRAGAAHVTAIDVGYGQLAWSLRSDPRVTAMDRVNVRGLRTGQLGYAPDLVTADLSFISLTLVLPALAACAAPDADFLLLVKPQFEAGKEKVGAGGVVRDPATREAAVTRVARSAGENGLGVMGVTASPLPGPAGNVEYFLWLRRGAPALDDAAVSTGDRGGTPLMSGPMNTKRTVLVVVHTGRKEALRSARQVVEMLTRAAMVVRVLAPEADDLGCAGVDVVPAAGGGAGRGGRDRGRR